MKLSYINADTLDALSGIIDSHFHSDYLKEKGLDARKELSLAFSEGFYGGIDIGCTSNDLPNRYELLKDLENSKDLKGFSKIALAGAMGPWELGDKGDTLSFEEIDSRLAILEQNLKKYHAHMLGEIGLDYYWNYGTKELQKYLFEAQLKLASKLNLPVSIHERESQSDTIDIISRLTPPKAGIIHCCDGCQELIDVALSLGYYISFAGNLTFKKNQELRDALTRVPLDRLLFETDAPYLTPVPLRGQPNSPRYVIYTYQCASEVLGLPLEELKSRVFQNFQALLER